MLEKIQIKTEDDIYKMLSTFLCSGEELETQHINTLLYTKNIKKCPPAWLRFPGLAKNVRCSFSIQTESLVEFRKRVCCLSTRLMRHSVKFQRTLEVVWESRVTSQMACLTITKCLILSLDQAMLLLFACKGHNLPYKHL